MLAPKTPPVEAAGDVGHRRLMLARRYIHSWVGGIKLRAQTRAEAGKGVQKWKTYEEQMWAVK